MKHEGCSTVCLLAIVFFQVTFIKASNAEQIAIPQVSPDPILEQATKDDESQCRKEYLECLEQCSFFEVGCREQCAKDYELCLWRAVFECNTPELTEF